MSIAKGGVERSTEDRQEPTLNPCAACLSPTRRQGYNESGKWVVVPIHLPFHNDRFVQTTRERDYWPHRRKRRSAGRAADLPGTEAPSLVKLMPNARCLRHGAAVRLLFLPPLTLHHGSGFRFSGR